MTIDAYAHVGMPRFQSVADYRGVMAETDIARAVLCSFDSCPDLVAIHSAFQQWPETFRGLGVPLGNDRAEMEAGARAQLEAGFSGLRLTDADVVERAWLLDILGGTVTIVCGHGFSDACAQALVRHLERHAAAIVIGGHFAGVRGPDALRSGALAALFGHPRFHVVFSRQGGFEAHAVRAWAEAVVAKSGWEHVMWGSEAPVLFWRNETVAAALAWIDGMAPTPGERAGFLGGNAGRIYFERALIVGPLALPFAPWDRARRIPAGLWANGLPVDQALAGRLVHAWRASGGHFTLGQYAQDLLNHALQAEEPARQPGNG